VGAETLLTIATAKPHHMVLAGRSRQKIDPVVKSINKLDPSIVTSFVQLDLTDNSFVRAAAREINELVR
jgi:NADP-dependent 3-hydroxy acid dehydrogenase YdfG